MDNNKFDIIFPIICADLAEKIKNELNLNEKDALDMKTNEPPVGGFNSCLKVVVFFQQLCIYQ